MGGQRNAPAALPPGKTWYQIVQETGWAPGPVWTGDENFAPAEIRSPDRPACSELLYRLRCPAPLQDIPYVVLYETDAKICGKASYCLT